jgi:hypothetical protein
MYSIETIRGGPRYLDSLAQRTNQFGSKFKSFLCLDWSQFDQRLPRVITDLYYTEFLERLIVISNGYQPTYEYPTYPDLTPSKMFERIDNILHFIHTWYNNMVFITADGYAYVREHAGVPSGMHDTQIADSFGNLFIVIDGMLEYGFNDRMIRSLVMFIMGDDNCIFAPYDIIFMTNFVDWFESYAFTRYNMILSKTKSIITSMRTRIEVLGYRINGGRPRRNVDELFIRLVLPEHGPHPPTMSARAIGIAYASAAMDYTFYTFCKDVYYMFLPFAIELTPSNREMIRKHLPGQLKMLDEYFDELDLTRFPDFHEISRKYDYWQGSLDYAPKWNYAHFINHPYVVPPSAQTLYDYRLEHNVQRRTVPIVF